MKKIITTLVIGSALLVTLTGCKSDPACWFAEDTIGCLVITDNVNSQNER